MVCLCKNPDGTLSQLCSGTCCQKQFHQSDAVEIRSHASFEDKVEYIFGIFLEKIDERIRHLEQLCMNNWKDGYQQGYEDGKNY